MTKVSRFDEKTNINLKTKQNNENNNHAKPYSKRMD
jgi:hypothetical protein